jgi:hypothetical protein
MIESYQLKISPMKEKMTSRERVHAALNFKIPDRVPIDLGGFQSGIHKKAYLELLGYLEKDEEIVILDPVQQLVRPSEDIYLTMCTTSRQAFLPGIYWPCMRQPMSTGDISQPVPRRNKTARIILKYQIISFSFLSNYN